MTTADEHDDDIAPVIELGGQSIEDPVDNLLRGVAEELADSGDADVTLSRLHAALPGPSDPLRLAVLLIGVAQLVVVAPWLVDADPFGLLGSSPAAHLTRDGALGLVVAVAAILTAWRPRWALPCFVTASVGLVAQGLAGTIDDTIVESGGSEFVHVPSIILTVMIGLSTIRLTAMGPRRGPHLPSDR